MNLTLEQLEINQSATIDSIGCEGSIKQRLLDMGFIKGSIVTLDSVAPLGDPIGIKVKGYKLSLRKHEARNIQVQTLE